jgi:hypothetical protein
VRRESREGLTILWDRALGALGPSDWSEKEDCFRIRWSDGDARKASERVVMDLENL